MPRRNPLAESEKEICKRLREFRESTRFTRVAFATAIGLDSSLLASYEHGYNPVRYDVAKRIGEVFQLNQKWLADGKGAMHGYIATSQAFESEVPKRALFSLVYKQRLKKLLDTQEKYLAAGDDAGIDISFPLPIGASKAEQYAWQIGRRIKRALAELPEELFQEYWLEIAKASQSFQKQHQKEIDRYLRDLKKKSS